MRTVKRRKIDVGENVDTQKSEGEDEDEGEEEEEGEDDNEGGTMACEYVLRFRSIS